MNWIDALFLGILEGLTEFLPVSSTGHLILLGEFLGLKGEGVKTFEIVIQFGAILAVMVYYRTLLKSRLKGLMSKDPKAIQLAISLVVAFIPAAVVGLSIHKLIKEHLFGGFPVAIGLAVGGVAMIAVEAYRKKKNIAPKSTLEDVTPKKALVIGFAQCFALWPGMSRSMSTIVGGQMVGLSTATAADFSFLLALPTLGAACAYDLLRGWQGLLGPDATIGAIPLLVGLITSFFVAWAVIAVFLHYLQRYGLAPFGYYRLVLAGLVIWLT